MKRTRADNIFELQSRVDTPSTPTLKTSSLSDAKVATETRHVPPMSGTPPGCVTLIKKKVRYYPEKRAKLKNNLLMGVGFLELTNAGDFTANV